MATNQARRWCFTLNNPDDIRVEQQWSEWPDTRYGICQRERGESGTDHYQGFILFTKHKRLGAVKQLLPRAHWEVARGTDDDNERYCSKEESRVEGPWRLGENNKQERKRTDWTRLKDDIEQGVSGKDFVERNFRLVAMYPAGIERIRRIYEPKRNWPTDLICICGVTQRGKSQAAHELAGEPGSRDGGFVFNGGKWWCDYAGERCVIMEEFAGNVPLRELLQLADRYPKTVETKGGSANLLCHSIIITSNLKPDQWYTNVNPEQLKALYRRITLYIWMGEREEENKCVLGPFQDNTRF